MHLPPFRLDHWLSAHDFADPPIRWNLASSTGPRWTAGALCALSEEPLDLSSTVMSYSPPQGGPALRAAVADFHGVDAEQVLITTGASEALSTLFCLLARPGAHILMPDPGYPAYAAMAGAWGMEARFYRLDRDDGFAHRAEAIRAMVDDDTAAVIVNTPHNPTGSVMPRTEIAALAADLAQAGVPLLVDEVYHPLYFDPPQASAAGIANAIVMSDMSKTLSLPGLRIGWMVVDDPALRERLVDARSYFTISGSPLTEALATQALRHRGAIIDRLERVARANIAMLDRLIGGSGERLQWVRPQGGTTCYPWLTDGRDSRALCEKLAVRGVLLAPGDCFGQPDHLRLGFTQQEDGFAQACAIIAEEVARL